MSVKCFSFFYIFDFGTFQLSVLFRFFYSHLFLGGFSLDVVEKVDVKGALKSSIFVAQKAAAPKIRVEFRQGSIGTIKSSLATSYSVWQNY